MFEVLLFCALSVAPSDVSVRCQCPCQRIGCQCKDCNCCTVKVKTAKREVMSSYPVRGNWWGHPGNVKHHLKTGFHAGKFDHSWIDSLTNAQAESLHSDDHEGRVQMAAVRRRTTSVVRHNSVYRAETRGPSQTRSVTVKQNTRYRSSCPGGVCPR